MVRVISEKLFSPPRSRHSSGETVDKELAARAVEALSSLDSKRFELSDYESSSDSHWDSELDIDGDSQEGFKFGLSDGSVGSEDIVKRRKERRRERNKLSAQAYRMRRREQSVKTQKVLSTLEEENTRLKNQVKDLENEINSIRQSVAGGSGPRLQPSPQQGFLKNTPPPVSTLRPAQPTFSPLFTNGNAAGGDVLKASSFHGNNSQQQQQQQSQQPVDNDQLQPRHQAPVDNFQFSQHASPVAVTMPTTFCFPTGATPAPTTTPTITTTTNITMATPQLQHPHTLHSDHNANASPADVITNGNTGGSGPCQNDNMNNNHHQSNNGNLLLVMPVAPAAIMPTRPFFNLSAAL